jgi:glycosyltransferase XagB
VAKTTIENNRIPNAKILVSRTLPKSKSHSLNEALKIAKGEILCVVDAEDEINDQILQLANTTFLNKKCDILQCGVQLMNYNSQWFSTLSILEYFFWFKSSLLYFSREKITPLGGNSIFFYKEQLREIGGWDESCLTEDADLGIRFALKKAKLSILYDAKTSTREETPENITS